MIQDFFFKRGSITINFAFKGEDFTQQILGGGFILANKIRRRILTLDAPSPPLDPPLLIVQLMRYILDTFFFCPDF
jgi:hypothetical protein